MADTKTTHNYSLQRNYDYESHDKDGNFNGLTEDEWRQRIREDWTCDKLNANHVTYIFHDKDTDDNGLLKKLHVHGCANFVSSLTQSEAIKRTGCSSDKNCKPINKKSQAYRYLLHITEQAISDGKHFYSEDELIILVADGKKFDYHKAVKANTDDEEEKEDAKRLKRIISAIQKGVYGDGGFRVNELSIYDKLLLDNDINELMSKKLTNKRAIENAIAIKEDTYRAKLRQKNGLETK